MSGDLREAVTMLAADNARLCGRLIAAEELAEAVADVLGNHPVISRKLAKALDAYNAAREN